MWCGGGSVHGRDDVSSAKRKKALGPDRLVASVVELEVGWNGRRHGSAWLLHLCVHS